jgi:hypothetical protein
VDDGVGVDNNRKLLREEMETKRQLSDAVDL